MSDYRLSGITFRSRLEARWARTFDILDWSWEYEPPITTSTPYLPDFYVPILTAYCDVKPWRGDAIYHADGWPEFRDKVDAAALDAMLIILPAIASGGTLTHGRRTNDGHINGWEPYIFDNDIKTAYRRAGDDVRWQPGAA